MRLRQLISSESGGISPEFHLNKMVGGGDGVGKDSSFVVRLLNAARKALSHTLVKRPFKLFRNLKLFHSSK